MAKKTISVADKDTLDEVKALLENSGYGLSALKSLLSAGNSVVKSVQRGVVNISAKSTTTITISTINTNKSILIVSDTYMASDSNLFNIYGEIRNATTLFFGRYSNTSFSSSVAWQVIEFY